MKYLVLALIVFGLGMMLARRGGARHQRPPHLLEPRDVDVLASGLDQDTLRSCIDTFADMYSLDRDMFVLRPEDSYTRIELTGPIEDMHLFFLVNYLRYPRNVDLETTSPACIAVTNVRALEAPIDHVSGADRVVIHVPAEDERYDLVHAIVAGTRPFEITFSDEQWVPVNALRVAPETQALIDLN